MDAINEKIKHAKTIAEVHDLLRKGQAQRLATDGTLSRRNRIAQKRIAKLELEAREK